MTTAGTITTEIALVKGILAGVNLEDPAAQQLQAILNALQFNLVIANAGAGAGIGNLGAQVATPPGLQTVGANANEPNHTNTKINKTGAATNLSNSMGLT